MPYAIRNKKSKRWLYGTDFRYSSPHQRLSDDTPYLYPTQLLAELAFKARRCNADYEIVKVNVEPVRYGRWIRDEFGAWCNACGSYAYRDKFDRPWESPYCPNCGARMEEQNDTD